MAGNPHGGTAGGNIGLEAGAVGGAHLHGSAAHQVHIGEARLQQVALASRRVGHGLGIPPGRIGIALGCTDEVAGQGHADRRLERHVSAATPGGHAVHDGGDLAVVAGQHADAAGEGNGRASRTATARGGAQTREAHPVHQGPGVAEDDVEAVGTATAEAPANGSGAAHGSGNGHGGGIAADAGLTSGTHIEIATESETGQVVDLGGDIAVDRVVGEGNTNGDGEIPAVFPPIAQAEGSRTRIAADRALIGCCNGEIPTQAEAVRGSRAAQAGDAGRDVAIKAVGHRGPSPHQRNLGLVPTGLGDRHGGAGRHGADLITGSGLHEQIANQIDAVGAEAGVDIATGVSAVGHGGGPDRHPCV